VSYQSEIFTDFRKLCDLQSTIRLIALKLTHVDLCQDQGKKSKDSPVSKVQGSHFKSAITQ
jgi:hypothetical protein